MKCCIERKIEMKQNEMKTICKRLALNINWIDRDHRNADSA